MGSICRTPLFDQRVVGFGQGRIVQFDSLPNKDLALFKRQHRQLFENFGKAHVETILFSAEAINSGIWLAGSAYLP